MLWVNTIDNNVFDPNKNKINVVTIQNGWVRYPTISDVEGSILIYDEEGKLVASSPVISTYKYVDNLEGRDKTGDGSIEKPYKSIRKAISDTPGSGDIIINLKAGQNHYWSYSGDVETGDDLPAVINIGTRNITFYSYGDTIVNEAEEFFRKVSFDTNWAYCINEINRPTIVLCWKYLSVYVPETNTNSITSTCFCGTNGVVGSHSIRFCGIHIVVDRVDELSSKNLIMETGWLRFGGSFSFTGCIFDSLPTAANSYILGWAGVAAKTDYIFTYRNYFSDGVNNNAKFSAPPKLLTINASDIQYGKSLGAYTMIGSNTVEFLSRNSVFCNGVYYINNPSKSYANLTTNFNISGVS